MILGELIAKLQKMDPEQAFRPGFGKGASWRGAYEEVAFEPVEQATVGEMLAHARTAVGTTLHGYKGGEYPCTLKTKCNVARWGDYGGDSDRMSVWWAANIEVAPLRAEVERLRAVEKDFREVVSLLQRKLQPAGSPPPGSAFLLAMWIIEEAAKGTPPALGDPGPRAAAYEAVKYALDRVQEDADFGYQAGWGTEIFRRLCLAEAAHLGKPFEEIEAERRKTFWRYEPRVLELQKQLEAARA